MALQVKHNFVSSKSDGLDTTKIQPSNWNEAHVLTAAIDKVLGTDSGGTTVQELACTAVGRAILAAADVAAQKAALSSAEIPIGGGYHWFTDTLPVQNGTVEVAWANGQAISRTTYSALFALLGTTYGAGNGSTTFNLPNTCEVTLVGRSTMGGATPRLLINHLAGYNTLGNRVGEGLHTQTLAEIAAHQHAGGTTGNSNADHTHGPGTLTTGDDTPDHTHAFTAQVSGGAATATSGAGVNVGSAISGTAGASNRHTHPVSFGNTAIQSNHHQHPFDTTSAGSSTPFNVVQPSLICNFVIRIK